MNKQSPRSIRGTAQSGFTLIELIVVIVILGILAATALPKFADLGGDARYATVKAAKGALEATSAMAHGKSLVAGTSPATVSLDGTVVNMTNTYPTADATLAPVAGLSSEDWIIQAGVGGGANLPSTVAGEVAFIPKSLTGNAKGATCYVKYTQAAVNGSPQIVVTASATNC